MQNWQSESESLQMYLALDKSVMSALLRWPSQACHNDDTGMSATNKSPSPKVRYNGYIECAFSPLAISSPCEVSTLLTRSRHGCLLRLLVRLKSKFLRVQVRVEHYVVQEQSLPEGQTLSYRCQLWYSVSGVVLETKRISIRGKVKESERVLSELVRDVDRMERDCQRMRERVCVCVCDICVEERSMITKKYII